MSLAHLALAPAIATSSCASSDSPVPAYGNPPMLEQDAGDASIVEIAPPYGLSPPIPEPDAGDASNGASERPDAADGAVDGPPDGQAVEIDSGHD